MKSHYTNVGILKSKILCYFKVNNFKCCDSMHIINRYNENASLAS